MPIIVGVTWMNLDSKLGVKMHITKKQIYTWNYSVWKLGKMSHTWQSGTLGRPLEQTTIQVCPGKDSEQ